MSKIAIVYKSKYGSTKKYAQWIAQESSGDLFESSKVKAKKISEYDIIVFGGGLYAGGIDYSKLGIMHKAMMGMLKVMISKKILRNYQMMIREF